MRARAYTYSRVKNTRRTIICFTRTREDKLFQDSLYMHVYTRTCENVSYELTRSSSSLPPFFLAREQSPVDRDRRLLTFCLYVAIRANRSSSEMRHNIEPRRTHKYSFVCAREATSLPGFSPPKLPSLRLYGFNMRICVYN